MSLRSVLGENNIIISNPSTITLGFYIKKKKKKRLALLTNGQILNILCSIYNRLWEK